MKESGLIAKGANDEPRRAYVGATLFRRALWLCLILLWTAYGISVAYLNPRKSLVFGTIAVITYFGLRQWSRFGNQKHYPQWYAAFGLLAAIPLGLSLSIAIPIEYVRDYAAYLRLAKSLFSAGDYSDLYNTVAWRPPGMALLYGVPIGIGIPEQLSVWIINSSVLGIVLLCIRQYLGKTSAKSPLPTLLAAASIICLATASFLLIPSAHLPAFAIMATILLVPSEALPLCKISATRWFAIGILIGVCALFRANLILQAFFLSIALLMARDRLGGVRTLRGACGLLLLCFLGVVIAIGPWTMRNWLTLHRLVPISTNGGMVFYSANSPANSYDQGKYHPELYQKLFQDVPDEVARDHEGWRRGWAAIAEQPVPFIISFRYRIPKLLGNPAYSLNYVRQQGRGGESWMLSLSVLEGAMFVAFWCLWFQMLIYRQTIRNRVFDVNNIPWPHASLLLVFSESLMFESADLSTYQLSFLPFILFVWLDARRHTRATSASS